MMPTAPTRTSSTSTATSVTYNTWPYNIATGVEPPYSVSKIVANPVSGDPVAQACTQVICPGGPGNANRNKEQTTISPMRFEGPPSGGTIRINGKTALIFSPADTVSTQDELNALSRMVAKSSIGSDFTIYGVIGLPTYATDMLVAIPS
jgi:hypothetical protein